jgi:hypothetical protein
MTDIIFTLSTVVCFTVALLYVSGCNRLNSRSSRD